MLVVLVVAINNTLRRKAFQLVPPQGEDEETTTVRSGPSVH